MKKLYRFMNKNSVGALHFNKSDRMVLEGNLQLDEQTLARLMTTVVRPTGKKRPEIERVPASA